MNFRPCIDLHHGKVKQIVGGTLNDGGKLIENFISEKGAEYYAKLYKKDKLKGGHIIMLGEGNEEEAIKALRAYPGGLQIGGGITADNGEYYLKYGASHIIVTSYVFKDGNIYFDNLKKLVNKVGKANIVLDLSCRIQDNKYYVVTDRWKKFTDFQVNEENLNMLSKFCDEFLIHAVDVEGKCNGIEEELIKTLGEWISIPTTYAGGISSFEDIDKLKKYSNKVDFTIGSALDIFGGKLSYEDLIKYIK
ncbi:MAG TPA: phosphoribosylformimino-5-aminoimidazole carboxamide ribotide isomerase [Clostridiaceae bacterium]